ncbi:PhzF family phenazine biosynthesis protein [Alkalimonas delamerensis]|uniref:PhzF family phenazine biosynthesis protein n=1 Tax=Alkalimonas delamerensis TaxID=265981 RepID=A0ABT9GRE4_9GAMM|nr:PhzF family phenazine biosynthesis protein [Alkalimonas delamerensis]MDP4529531.1 PhzF family phenazine biosynthesis protein [Alkalimonas delamerensis]
MDAFTDQVFSGNPAAVCPLTHWLDDGLLQRIAEENNLSETAFFVPEGDGYRLRWFTPEAEVDLCGHATLAAAHVLYRHLGYNQATLEFATRSGPLQVTRSDNGYQMDFPASRPQPVAAPAKLLAGLGKAPKDVLAAFDYIAVYHSAEEVEALAPDFEQLRQLGLRGVVATAPGPSKDKDVDFVSRCFFPKLRVNEDPVTGSAHCQLAPYWANKLGKEQLSAYQASKRGGTIHCQLATERVLLSGQAVDFMQGEISLVSL